MFKVGDDLRSLDPSDRRQLNLGLFEIVRIDENTATLKLMGSSVIKRTEKVEDLLTKYEKVSTGREN